MPALCKNFANSSKPLLASLNIQSLMSKHSNLKDFLADSSSNNIPIDILAIQETWSIHHPHLVNIPGFNFIHKQRPSGRGGGVGFYIRENLSFEIRDDLTTFIPKIFECLTISITLNSKKITFSSIYRSPSSNAQDTQAFLTHLDSLLFFLSSNSHTSFICLDSNINILNTPCNLQYLSTINDNNFIQCIEKATRIHNHSSSLIDHILTNCASSSYNSGVLISDISDHFPVFVELPSKSQKSKTKTNPDRNFSKHNMEKFRTTLSNLDWLDVKSSKDVDTSYGIFWDTFKTLFDLNFPLSKKKFNKNYHKINGYMTKGLLISRSTKIKLLKISVNNPTAENLNAYRKFRNLFTKIMRASKKLYFDTNFAKAKKDPKKTWDLIREAIGSEPKNPKIQKLNISGTSTEDPDAIANEFNTFFANAGKNVAKTVGDTEMQPESFLKNNNAPTLEFSLTSQGEIVDIIKNFQSKSSYDIDGVSMKLLKAVAIEISTPLAHIFNLSLKKAIFPNALKLSRIVPIHKSGKRELCDNYRPIALLSSFSKILEKIVSLKLVNHLDYHKLLSPRQFGFQRKKNTEHNLLNVINYISKALNDGNFCIGIFLDLRKAFDVCNHEILFKKLKNKGVTGNTLNWFKSYLSGRRQIVDVNGCKSKQEDIDMSVIQGSILGPILFLVYIDDLPFSSLLETFIFADDTQGLKAGKNLPELIDLVNIELKKWAQWFRTNKMAVNVNKTKFIIFHTRGKKVDLDGKKIIFDNNDPSSPFNTNLECELERIHNNHTDPSSRSYKLLGILLDEHLTFNHHIDYLKSKLSKALYCINRVKNFLPQKTLKTIYHSLFHSHLLYCPLIVNSSSKSNIEKIFIMQKKAIRSITNSTYHAHTEPIFTSLKILPYHKIIYKAQLTFFHSIHNKYAPTIFSSTWQLNSERNPAYDLRNATSYFVPPAKFAFFERSPLHTLPKIWNNAGTVTFYDNPTTFRISLTEDLLKDNTIPLNIPLPPPSPPTQHPST